MAVKRSSSRASARKSSTATTARAPRTAAGAKSAAPRRPATRAKAPARGSAPRKAATTKPAHSKATKAARTRTPPTLQQVVLDALAELKALDVRAMDVRGITDITDVMVVASGTSDRHVKSIADRVLQRCKEAGFRPFGMEGERDGEWVLLDLQDLVLHVMLPRVREFYALEKLWEGGAERRA
jgi:ribosome-associated protein